MKRAHTTAKKLLKAVLVSSTALLAVGVGSSALAGGTAAGTNVQNTFTLDYSVSGVAQTQIDTGPSGSNTPTEFTVDRLIDLTVTSSGDTTVAPGATNQDLVYSVVNNGNDTQAYDFSIVNETTDNFDPLTSSLLYVLDDGDGVYEPGTGAGQDGALNAYTLGTASPDLLADARVWVVVRSNMPAAGVVVDTDTAAVSLIADTLEPSTSASAGTAVTGDTDGNSLTGVAENVLADGSGTANELANAGDHSATGSYIVADPDITATKAVTVFSQDGTGCATIPGTPTGGYSVPNSCVEYVITVVNTGATATATGITIADTLADQLTFVAAVDGGSFTGGTLTTPAANTVCTGGACVISYSGASLAAGATGTITIRATVQ